MLKFSWSFCAGKTAKKKNQLTKEHPLYLSCGRNDEPAEEQSSLWAPVGDLLHTGVENDKGRDQLKPYITFSFSRERGALKYIQAVLNIYLWPSVHSCVLNVSHCANGATQLMLQLEPTPLPKYFGFTCGQACVIYQTVPPQTQGCFFFSKIEMHQIWMSFRWSLWSDEFPEITLRIQAALCLLLYPLRILLLLLLNWSNFI